MRKNIPNEDYRALLNNIISRNDIRSLAVTLIAYTGCRPNEVLKLKDSSIEIDDEKKQVSIYIKASKRSNNRLIQLPSHLYAPVKVLRDRMKETKKHLALLLGNTSKSINSNYVLLSRHFFSIQAEILGEVRYTLKSWRHALATRALKSGIDIIEVQVMLGHRKIENTISYLQDYKQSIVLNQVHRLVEQDV